MTASLVGAVTLGWLLAQRRAEPEPAVNGPAAAVVEETPSRPAEVPDLKDRAQEMAHRDPEDAIRGAEVRMFTATEQAFHEQIVSFVKYRDLWLSREDMESLAAAFVDLANERVRHEASIAVVDQIDAHSISIKIPAYPEFGDAMRECWFSEVDAIMEPHDALRLKTECELGSFQLFLAFGECTRDIVVRAEIGYDGQIVYHADSDVVVSDELSNRFAPRSPSILAARGQWYGAADQITNGEFAAIRPFLSRIVPKR